MNAVGNITFGSFIAEKRKAHKFNLRDTAKHLNIAYGYLCDIEQSRRPAPTGDFVERISAFLNLDKSEHELLLDLAAKSRNTVSADLPDYIMEKDIVRAALRVAKEVDATDCLLYTSFINPTTNKQWRIEIDGHTIRTCLHGGKVKEILCDSAFQVKSMAASAMMSQMRKGFVYQNRDAAVGQARCHRFVGKDSNGFMPLAAALTRDDFFLTRVVGDFEDEILYHFDGSGEILEMCIRDRRKAAAYAPGGGRPGLVDAHHPHRPGAG